MRFGKIYGSKSLVDSVVLRSGVAGKSRAYRYLPRQSGFMVSTHVEYPLPINGFVYEWQNERQLDASSPSVTSYGGLSQD